MSARELALFPLRSVLYPGGSLSLRIFEVRYLDMVSRCLREETGFGVILIREGAEVGAATTFELGTLAFISDWYQRSDGLLGITAVGDRRFRIMSAARQRDQLLLGQVELLASEPRVELPPRYAELAQTVRAVLRDSNAEDRVTPSRYDDASWLSYRLAELLPATAEVKQSWLELDDPIERLAQLLPVLESLRASQGAEE